MKFLQLKCPPPVVMVIAAVIAMLAAQRDLVFLQQQINHLGNIVWPLLFLVAGISTAVAGIREFSHHKTTISPLNPEKTTSLVVSGIFQFTRNPMYLGILVVLLGWADFLDSIFAFVGPLGFFAYITLFQIQPEEKAMQRHFGDEYTQYCSSVRRWL